MTQATLIENADSGHGGRGEGQLGDALTIFALSLVAFTFALGPEFIAFQTRFAVFAQNMLRDGPSFFPTLYGQAYPDYPALPTVLIWLLSKPVGRVTPLTAILPTAVASSLILVVVYRIGALRSRQWGLYAVLMTLLTYAFVFSARSISPDQYTALATAASFYVCDSATLLGRRRRLWWLPVLWVLSFACRGPIGLIVPAAVVGVYYLVRREYRAIILVGVGAACLGAACMALLLAAARYQGGEELYREVIRMQASDRLTHKSDSPLEYWLGCFGTYAISYPLAVLVVAACARRVMRRGDPDAMLLACLAAWVLIVLAGMSIPGKKTMRYVLPIAPALGLVAAYAMVDPAPTGLLRRARDGFIVFCRLVAPAATIAAMVTWIARNRFDPPIEGPLLLTAVVLAVLSAAAWLARSRQTCDAGRARTAVLSAAVAFLVFFVGVVSPAMHSREKTAPLVAAVEAIRKERPGPLAFYWIFPDNKDIKYMVNLDAAETPLFISTIDGLRSEPTAYFIAEEKHFRMLPKDVADKMMVRVRGRLGHDPVVVFTHRGN